MTTPLTLGMLADDLTGACDTGAQFSALGARVLVLAVPTAALPAAPAPAASGGWDCVVLNTASRHAPPEQAGQAVATAVARFAAAAWPMRYKKIDSTLRGPLAAELAPLLERGATLLLAPAFPSAGRTVTRGVLHVAGRPVHETEFGQDPHNPLTSSHLPTLLGALGPPGTLGELAAEDLEHRAPGAALRLAELRRRGARVIVADADEDAHLEQLAALLRTDPAGDLIAVGSAGLARAVARDLLPAPRPAPLPTGFPRPGPVLVVAGSRTTATRGQVQSLLREPGVHGLALDPAELDAEDWESQRPAWLARQTQVLARAGERGAATLVLSVTPDPPATEAGDGSDAAHAAHSERFARRSARLNAALGALTVALAAASRAPLGGLVLTGGDIAAAVLGALSAEALQLGPEVLPGIPLCWPVAGPQAGLPIVTKAGGFGAPEALREAVHFLRHGAAHS